MAHTLVRGCGDSGHSGGPVLGPRGEIVGWVVRDPTVGPSALNFGRIV